MFLVFMTLGFVLEVQRTLADKHQQEKSHCMLCYRLASLHPALFFTWTMQSRNIWKEPPRFVAMCVNIKHISFVTVACLHINSNWF